MINELMARAGASDRDREAWLAERRQGVTATEVARVFAGETVDSVVNEKLSGKTIAPTKHMTFGHMREEALAFEVRGLGAEPEHRVFYAVDNPRYLASPDGIGQSLDDLFLVEIKTSKHPIDSNPLMARYEAQMQWQMFVTGAQECIFLHEQHDDDWGSVWPTPVHLDRRTYAYDAELVAELKDIADKILETLDSGITPVTDLDALAERVDAAKAAKKAAEIKLAEAEDAVRAVLAEGGQRVTGLWKVTVSKAKPGSRFDQAAFKEAEPGLYKKFQKETKPSKPRVTVTKVKGAK